MDVKEIGDFHPLRPATVEHQVAVDEFRQCGADVPVDAMV